MLYEVITGEQGGEGTGPVRDEEPQSDKAPRAEQPSLGDPGEEVDVDVPSRKHHHGGKPRRRTLVKHRRQRSGTRALQRGFHLLEGVQDRRGDLLA